MTTIDSSSRPQPTPTPSPSPKLIAVAEYILEREGAISTMKLQKLLYFAQGWSLAITNEPLFEDDFEAWSSGPVLPALVALHRGEYTVGPGFFTQKLRELNVAPLPDRRDVLARAKASYSAWYEAEPVAGEEDSPSHEYVREIVPDLIEALEIAHAELAAGRAKTAADSRPSQAAYSTNPLPQEGQ